MYTLPRYEIQPKNDTTVCLRVHRELSLWIKVYEVIDRNNNL
jgi:hypothetical protein